HLEKRMVRAAGARALTVTLPQSLSKISARGLWAGICLGRFEVRGKTIRGKGGGAIIRRFILRSLCLLITRGFRLRWREGIRFTSSPTDWNRLSRKPKRR